MRFTGSLRYLKKAFFPNTNNIAELFSQPYKPNFFGKAFIAIYFPFLSKNLSKEKFLQLLLNRIIIIAGIMGGCCLWSKYLELHFIEGVFLLLTLSALFPYIGYIVAKKSLNN